MNDFMQYYKQTNEIILYDDFKKIYDKFTKLINKLDEFLFTIKKYFDRRYSVDPIVVFLFLKDINIEFNKTDQLRSIKQYMQVTIQKNSINLFISKTAEFLNIESDIYNKNNCSTVINKYIKIIFEILNKDNKCIMNEILINYLNYYPTKFDQCFFINNILDNNSNTLINKKNMQIYQFVMGSGKSTTIIPYILYKN